ncbi:MULTISPECIES: tetratricopeptide repeat protein [spotted fever group]|uniref:Putative O-linked N-acetylglucosamine transferase, SPINDLY family n=1 Tax=Rickettsia tamurae subsp. buchneri TaxID=1462938 RepID=A0A8E0WKI3_9RICK|nr:MULTISPECIES: tetratricopeptide repeat protein [spotted fever group]EER20957.1 TPR [Rickettsia endosymbiont of Ixodes scapularis]KDO02293.1 putative O-linked N-acetylglucosamine transferase, SPINDLY family [Rickettsia tamurae subsp. buchneri]KDO02464.1 putative O-linked N-acetylglucosamine transferase, SPINDLY family [Rickettsia tamurae subsp. buchneri]
MLISLINLTQNLLYSIKIRLNPNDPKVYYDKGRTLEKLGKYKAALKWFNKALELDPNNPTPHIDKGVTLFNWGKYNLALKSFNKALELGPDNPDASTRKQLLLDMQK